MMCGGMLCIGYFDVFAIILFVCWYSALKTLHIIQGELYVIESNFKRHKKVVSEIYNRVKLKTINKGSFENWVIYVIFITSVCVKLLVESVLKILYRVNVKNILPESVL